LKDQKIKPGQEEVQRRLLQEYIFDLEEAKDQAEEDIQKAHDYMESIFASSADAIGIADHHGNISQWNKAAEEIYGFTFEELKGRPVFHLYADHRELAAMQTQLRRNDFVRNYEIKMTRSDGSVFPCSLSIRVLRDQAGKVMGSITAARDLSDIKQAMVRLQDEIIQHKRAQQALRESEQLLCNIIDFLPDATLVIDKQGKVIAWNKAIEEMTGVKAQDMMGKGNYEYSLPFYGERRPILIDLVLNPLKEVEREKYDKVQRKDLALSAVAHFPDFRGRETYLFGKAGILLDSQGEIIGAVESIRDITDLRRAETERLRFSTLESLAILAGGIAHDFNNILTAIMGNIGLAMLEHQNADLSIERLTEAENACLQAQILARQLLTFAKGGAPVKEPVSVGKLITETISFAVRGSQVRCEFTFPDNLWAIEADPGQIGQVFQNLAINAIQAMPAGGTINVRAANLNLTTSIDWPLAPGNYIEISVQDQGIGILAEHLPKIFDPYFTTKQKGSGLGMATTYSIIKKHHGHIAVESKPGVGTTFNIYLPAIERLVAPQPENNRGLIVGKGKVLVMDDHKMVREVLGRMLTRLGYEAEFARDGGEALKMFVQAQGSGQAFAAVILDLTVPGAMGGKETMVRLLEINPQVKAIVSSGYSDDPIMADFQKYGFSGFIAKPYKIIDLGKILHDVLMIKPCGSGDPTALP
jgi:two-component system, cell cycle sensor histidine kinase and response regulator CckA